jgi:hypothetical protein
MPFGEFATLLGGINGDTPLGATVQIRAEKNQKIIKKFSREQRRIYNDWRQRRAKTVTREEYDAAMKGFSQAFRSLGGEK